MYYGLQINNLNIIFITKINIFDVQSSALLRWNQSFRIISSIKRIGFFNFWTDDNVVADSVRRECDAHVFTRIIVGCVFRSKFQNFLSNKKRIWNVLDI